MSNRASRAETQSWDLRHGVTLVLSFLRRLAPELADVISQAVFHITRLVKSLLHQLLDPLLRGRPHDRGKAHIPLWCDFEVRRQTGHVDEALGLADRPLVERCDAGCEGLDKPVEV